jgi:phenylacetic acid degradation operon negative regulatory protein
MSNFLEKREKNIIRITKLQQIVLGIVSSAGILTLGLLAPNALKLLKIGSVDKKIHSYKYKSILRTKDNLIKNGFLEVEMTSFGKVLRITENGKKMLDRAILFSRHKNAPPKWDKKWRVIIFDIPEKKKLIREKLRATLISIGFIRLQNSVWIYPYPCEELVSLLKADLHIGKDVLYMIVDQLEGDQMICRYFNLKN